MLRFRRKIILSHLIILIICIAVVYPFVQWSIDWISRWKFDGPMSLDLESQIFQIKRNVKIGALIVAIVLLIAISLFDVLMIQYIFRPIQWIIDAVSPYQEGKVEFLPKIILKEPLQTNEFVRLADTLNSLNEKIQKHIEDLKLQRRETEEILESIGEGIVATDMSARVKFVNKAACTMLGLEKGAILKQTLKGAEGELAHRCHDLIVHSLQASEQVTDWWRGAQFLELSAAPLVARNRALIVLRDKTSDLKIVELGKEFIANASHELRTPITIIRGFAETLHDRPDLSREMIREITEKITRTCIRFDKVIRGLLTLTDVENLSMDRLKNVNLVLLAENCIHHLLVAHPKAKVKFSAAEAQVPILADPDLVELAISNLMENAVKYSQEEIDIHLKVTVHDQAAEISVEDRGIGIPEKDLHRLFERFFTVDKARSRKSGGAGLGLSIVKTIVEKHKGQVAVESKLGVGSLFRLKFPIYPFK
jgi:signal transduction histidine kinase